MEEKRIRKQDFHIIKRERQMLEGERRQLEQLKHRQKDLQAREQKLVEYEALILSIKELKVYGITLEVLQQYIAAVEERSILEHIDPKMAANNLVTEIKINNSGIATIK